ncbi:MAG TPA: hemerythrin domain-containing protein [Polyangium sp.]|nr:hemerythrin domain-containing protein [Polyangium sp.]
MDALDLLEQQHRDVRDLLERLASNPGEGTTHETVLNVARIVEAHVRTEEAYVYIACASKLRGEQRALIAEEQRASILAALGTLRTTPPSDAQFAEHVKSLLDRFLQHVDVEEDAVFPKLKRTLTDEALDVLGEALAQAHERFLLEDKPWADVDSARIHRRSPRTLREPIVRRGTIYRSGVRQKVRLTPCG